ncbi:uncharacterized protein [Mytilus edulis]|uniref:uncharacterized protein n=1 Tax=Mytilus edulis TaxID=6550 RepID=UPI0039F0CD90
MDVIQRRLTDIQRIEKQNFKAKQNKKFKRDRLNQQSSVFEEDQTLNLLKESKSKQPRKRRFKKQKHTVQDKLVVNLSSIELTTSEEKLLSKGLNFCPAPATVNNLQLETDVEAFARRLRLKEHFNRQQKKNLKEAGMNESDYESDEGDICIPKFKKKSKWNPPKSKNDNLESFITSVKAEVRSSISGKQVKNISKSESQAMINLKDRNEIVIKQADKGSAVVVMNKADYIEEGNRQLSNAKFYKELACDPTKEISKKINDVLSEMNKDKQIDDDTYDYLRPDETCTAGRFYLLPKLHKEGIPGRPIVSANGHPTEKISEFVDYHLRPHVKQLPSHIQDTTDYLKKLNSLSPLPNNTILVSMDVCSLYTNIPKDEGIAACEKVWNTRKDKHPQTDCLVQLLKLVLENNNFIFNDKHFLQIDGTSMGTKMAPSFANIFMGDLEERILLSVPYKPLSWLRFIDDIDMKWNDTAEHLQDFLDHCNQFHHSIKFTSEFSSEKIGFLDTTTFVKNGIMTTDLHTKKTDKHQFLSPKSCHPKHCSRSIPYSQAIRLKRICSSESKLNYRLGQLKTQLKSRGYKTKNITDAFDKAQEKDRASLMEYKDKTTRADRIPLFDDIPTDLLHMFEVHFGRTNIVTYGNAGGKQLKLANASWSGLDCNSYVPLWVSWMNRTIKVGTGTKIAGSILFSLTGINYNANINNIMVFSHNPADWIFDFPAEEITELETVSTTETMTKLRKSNILKTTDLSSKNYSCYCLCSNINNFSFKEDDLFKKIEQIRSDLVVDTKIQQSSA